MTRKNFIAIANIVKSGTIFENNQPLNNTLDKKYVVERLAEYLATQNSRFDYEKFINACKCE